MSFRARNSPCTTGKEEPHLEIIIDENDSDTSRGRGIKRLSSLIAPQPAKVCKSTSRGFLGWLFPGWFMSTEEDNSDEDLASATNRSILMSSNSNLQRSHDQSAEVYYAGEVQHPDVICTTSKKLSNKVQPMKNEVDESQEEIEVVGEVRRSPPGQLFRERQSLEEAFHAVKSADVVTIEEETSSDSISILSDAIDNNEVKGTSPEPDDSISRQNTPNRFRSEDFETPKESWSRSRRLRPQKPRTVDIPRVNTSNFTRNKTDFSKIILNLNSSTSAYQTPVGLEPKLVGELSRLRYENLIKQKVTDTPKRRLKRLQPSKATDLVIRAKTAIRKNTNRQQSEVITLDENQSSNGSGVEILEVRSRSTSEAPSVSSYLSSGLEKVDDLLANLSNVGHKTNDALDNFKKYKNEKKYRGHKEMELVETSKQIREIRDLHTNDLIESVRLRLEITGIRPPLPKKPIKEEFPQLPDEALKLCERAWKRGNLEEVFCEGFDTKIMRKDLETLRPGKWLNDEVILFFLNLIADRSKNDSNLPKVREMVAKRSNTYVIELHEMIPFGENDINFSTKGYASVKRWTRKVDIFAHDILLIPVHVGGVHWCMAVVDFGQKSIDYFDPMHHNDNGALDNIRDYLEDECKDKKKTGFDFSGWKFNERMDCPSQQNGYDCGVFSTHFAEYCARRAPLTFSQQNMDYFRKRMLYEIVAKKLM